MWPRRGASNYLGFVDPHYDWDVFGQLHQEAGIIHGLTRVWLLNAWWSMIDGGRLPMKRPAPGAPFDCYDWDEAGYFDPLAAYVRTMNAYGIVPILTFLTVYEWSDRGARGDVPDANAGPFRFNVNGFVWGGGENEDATFFALPDRWLRTFIEKVCARVRDAVVVYETAQEMPEKPMHWRIAAEIRKHDAGNRILCNRQDDDDAPGQFDNMRIGQGDLDMIAFHNWCSMDSVRRVFPREIPAGRPETFEKLVGRSTADAQRIVMSTDGCRLSGAYFGPAMLDVMRWAWERGVSIEWQSPAKRAFFTDHAADYGDLRKYLDTGALAQIGAL